MSDLLSRLAALAEERTPEAIKALVSRGLEVAEGKLSEDEFDLVEELLLELGAEADALAPLGAEGLISVLTLYGMRGPNEAALEYLKHTASLEELEIAHKTSVDAALKKGVDKNRDWARLESVLKLVGPSVLKVIPVLMAAA